MRQSILVLGFLALLLLEVQAQVFLNEDFNTGNGLTPPIGWTAFNTGTSPADWRFDNPGARPFTLPFTGKQAIVDCPMNGPGTSGVSYLVSPVINLLGATQLTLSFDEQLRDNMSGRWIEVFDGITWNQVYFQLPNGSQNVDVGYLMPNASTTVTTSIDISAAAGGSALARLRFAYQYGDDFWWALDNIKVSQPIINDLEMLSIDAPVDHVNSCTSASGMQTVRVTIKNRGTQVLATGTSIPLQFSVNGAAPQLGTLTLAAPLKPLMTVSYVFPTLANLVAPVTNQLRCSVLLPGDGDASNNAKTRLFHVSAGLAPVALPYFENFDLSPGGMTPQPPAGWIQDLRDAQGPNSNWLMNSGQTASSGTGPAADHSTGTSMGIYAYLEDDSAEYPAVNLLSPCLNLTTTANPVATFWLHSHNFYSGQGIHENQLSIDVISFPGGYVTTDVISPLGDDGASTWAASQWQRIYVDLSTFAGSIIQIRFRGRTDNNSSSHDIAIDDVTVFDAIPSPGQAPRLGLATFDINGATEINGLEVLFGRNGPYFASITQGGLMTMRFNGEINNPITVLYGPYSPLASSYPGGIGQFDIGGPLVVPLGIPSLIEIFANGIGFAQSGFSGFPLDALFFTDASGNMEASFQTPNYGIPPGTLLTTMQAVILAPTAPFVYISNAVTITVN